MLDRSKRAAPLFLASVATPSEAATALAAGAEIVDCKNPSEGALGALDAGVVAAIVKRVAGQAPVSATIGDLPSDPDVVSEAALAMAATSVDYVKIGFFGDRDPTATIAELGRIDLGGARLAAVLMADRDPSLTYLKLLAQSGFAVVMLDTADKNSGALPDVLPGAWLAEFVGAAHALGLVAGLAGSLARRHIDGLARIGPDIIGFRGALCDGGRTGALSGPKCAEIARAIAAASQAHAAPATA